jgi:hypothetical protein
MNYLKNLKDMKKETALNDFDLMTNQYSMELLEKNIDNFNKKILLRYQKLNAEFCMKYILDMDIESGSEDSYIYDKIYILNRQPHITDEEFDKAFKKYYTNY